MYTSEDYRTAFVNLLAFCQNQGYLPNGEKIYEEMAAILEMDVLDVEEFLENA